MSWSCIVRRIAALGLGIAIGILGTAPSASAQGKTVTRPIGDWLSAQGSCSSVPAWLTTNYFSWTGRTPPNGEVDLLATMDYAGVDARSLGLPTAISGTVIERVVDGRTLVKVKVGARGALTYVEEYDVSGPVQVVFGTTPDDVAGGASPTLGNASFELEYVVERAPGGPMEDVFAALFFDGTSDWVCSPAPVSLPFEDLHLLGFAGTAGGPCSDGSASRFSVVQTGLIGAAFKNGFRGALGDAFPAEFINIRPGCD